MYVFLSSLKKGIQEHKYITICSISFILTNHSLYGTAIYGKRLSLVFMTKGRISLLIVENGSDAKWQDTK